MSKEDRIQCSHVRTLVREEEKKYALKSPEERIDDACRINIKSRQVFTRGYSEIRPKVIREFEEDEKKREALIPYIERVLDSNPLLKNVLLWSWLDEPPPLNTPARDTVQPPEPPKKTCREKLSDFWKSAKNIIPTEAIARYYANVKDFFRTYWERGTHTWYFDLTPMDYSPPEVTAWPVNMCEIYWWPGDMFITTAPDYVGPLAIGHWPVDNPVPYFPIPESIKSSVLEKWEKLGEDERDRNSDRHKSEEDFKRKEENMKKADRDRQKVEEDRNKADRDGEKVEEDRKKADRDGEKVEEDRKKADRDGQIGEEVGKKVEEESKPEEEVKSKKKRKYCCDDTCE